ncbi:MAG: triose-phosphate isomerase [Bacteroidales bacterium]|jgi:triosephosphate isomerase|nr:triose-phosphate isomerase [Bacteroidales bacterium]
MRKNIVAGNWKMNKTFPEGIELIQQIINQAEVVGEVELIIAPPFIFTAEASKMLNGVNVKLGAQDCSNYRQGAYTGEISPLMLKSAGVEYVILGHSERRKYFHETNDLINAKIKLALETGLKPIICCGEILQERERDEHFQVVNKQIKEMFDGITADQFPQLIIAYEPVWAIGTGKTATPDQAQEMHQFIRENIKNSYGTRVADNLSILYGGSCKPANAKELFSNPDVDGGLIGGASLKADDFIEIAKSF